MNGDAAWSRLGGTLGTPFVDVDTNGWSEMSNMDTSGWRGHLEVSVEIEVLGEQ